MFGMEELLCEMGRDGLNERGLPPGFRFHPTDEELVTFYLASKVFNGSFCGVEIAELDLNRCEPWDLPDVAKMGEREWYFFSSRDRKYPTGLRTNRATSAGYWKATGKDREVYSASTGALLGMKKTLVFYKGRAPRGEKTMWVMHEYRLDGDFSYRHTCKEECVICRIFHKDGDKKNGVLMQERGFLLADSPKHSPNWLPQPQLFEGQSKTSMDKDLQDAATNLLMNHLQDHDLKSLIMSPALLPNKTAATITNKECKIEAGFPEYQLPDSGNSLSLLANYSIPYDHNPLFNEMDCNETSTSFGLTTKADFQTVWDNHYPFRVAPDYWPLEPSTFQS